jgi:hypothetical protein
MPSTRALQSPSATLRAVSANCSTGPCRDLAVDRVAAFEREAVLAELNVHGYRATETARALGLDAATCTRNASSWAPI